MIRQLIYKWRKKHTENNIKNTALSCGGRIYSVPGSYVNKKTILGDNVSFNGMKIIGDGPVRIGNSFHCAEGCYIISQNHDYDHGNCLPYDSQRSVEKETIIEDAVWLGVGVIVLGGAHIGEGAIIQAGSVVVGDIPPYAIAGGHPAKVFKYRDIEHYEKLKKDGKFLKV